MNSRGDKIAAKNQIICDKVFEEIKNNTPFYRQFFYKLNYKVISLISKN